MRLELRSRPLGGTPLAALAGSGEGPADWYEPRPDGDGWKRRVVTTAGEFEGAKWLDSLLPAISASGAAADRLQSVADQGGAVVTSGQQPGLFGGPLYTWFKAVSALALADVLQERTGVAMAPVFWAATDDADFTEASATTVSVTGGAEVIRIETSPVSGNRPLSDVPLGDVTVQLEVLARSCGSAPNRAALDAAYAAYSNGTTVGAAYVRLLRALLEPLGVAVLDAAHPAVRAAGAPLLERALDRSSRLDTALKERSKDLRTAGYRAQVAHVPGRTLVFRTDSSGRQRILLREAQSALAGGREDLTPNVLLRPVMERAILPTVAYVGGPAEVAYFAQVSAVADELGVKRPLIVPRWSGVIIEPHVRRILRNIRADVEDFADPHKIETRVAREQLPAGLLKALKRAQTRVQTALAEVEKADSEHQVVPRAVIEGAKRQLEHKLDRLERRYIAATKRRGSELLVDVATARGSLYPNGEPQERALNGIPLLAKYGDELFAGIKAKAREHAESL